MHRQFHVEDSGDTITIRGCALDSGTLTTDTEIIRMSHCGSFYYEDRYAFHHHHHHHRPPPPHHHHIHYHPLCNTKPNQLLKNSQFEIIQPTISIPMYRHLWLSSSELFPVHFFLIPVWAKSYLYLISFAWLWLHHIRHYWLSKLWETFKFCIVYNQRCHLFNILLQNAITYWAHSTSIWHCRTSNLVGSKQLVLGGALKEMLIKQLCDTSFFCLKPSREALSRQLGEEHFF